MEQEYYIGQKFEGSYPPAAAVWCNRHNAYIEGIDSITKKVKETYIEVVQVEKEVLIPAEYDTDGNIIVEEHTEIIMEEVPQEKTRKVSKTFRVFEIKAIPEPAAPTEEEQKQNRARAYQEEVDPITSHISRLRDEEQTEEVEAKIAQLIAERAEKVEEIKARFPYPVDA